MNIIHKAFVRNPELFIWFFRGFYVFYVGGLLFFAWMTFSGCASVRNPICIFNCGDKQIFNPGVTK